MSWPARRAVIRSMPMMATWIRGRVLAIRMFPSLERVVMWPVSAQARLHPEIPMSAVRNFSRRAARAARVSVGGSSV